ncbi:MAG: MYXO-CTERM sorting domain-containing protein [Myxococcota bacterium]|nr:MYXO-CTERM sorting domain-containing protein [Myxococcota bacterium]
MRALAPLVSSALLLVASPALARVDLVSGGGFLFDIHESSDFAGAGSLGNGSVDAYDTCYALRVGGVDYMPMGASTLSLAGRQVELPTQSMAGLTVRRLVYVPAAGGDWARYLEILDNPGASPVTTTVEIFGNLGSDSGTVISASSSGDARVDTSDLWFATDDAADGAGDPSLAHVFSGASPGLGVSTASMSGDNLEYSWSVTVPASGRVVIMHFAVQTTNRAAAAAEAMTLESAPDAALMGADTYLDAIVNFDLASEGAPQVRFEGPFEAEEGAEIVIDVRVEDPEGDAVEHSWDLDDDGVFGEAMGALSHTIPAGSTDGPGTVRVGVEARDALGNTARRYRAVRIDNVDPRVTSTPPAVVSVGVDVGYAIEVEDPAGAMDAPTFTLIEGPSRMTVSDGGTVSWVPSESDVTLPGEPIEVAVTIDDGDEGVVEHRWSLQVSPNRPPSAPIPAYPTDRVAIVDRAPRLVAQNAEDPDLDPLRYEFEIDTVDTFDSPDLRASGPIEETAGFTAWTLDPPLREDQVYFWRVRALDGSVESDWRQASFFVVRDPDLPPPDAGGLDGGVGPEGGVIPGPDAGVGGGGGCAITPTPTSPWPLAVLLALPLLRRRRLGRWQTMAPGTPARFHDADPR